MGLVPAISINLALCHPDQDRPDKRGATSFAPVSSCAPGLLNLLTLSGYEAPALRYESRPSYPPLHATRMGGTRKAGNA